MARHKRISAAFILIELVLQAFEFDYCAQTPAEKVLAEGKF